MKYCSNCAAPVERRVPPGDDRPRHVCPVCETIHYLNPRMVVGCVPEWDDRVLMCRRAIEPQKGLWTVPAGFLETGESADEGAMRETLEEANARVEIVAPFALYSLPHVDQIYLIYRARMITPEASAGAESLQVALFREAEIPWEELAFTTIRRALTSYFEDRARKSWRMHFATVAPGKSD